MSCTAPRAPSSRPAGSRTGLEETSTLTALPSAQRNQVRWRRTAACGRNGLNPLAPAAWISSVSAICPSRWRVGQPNASPGPLDLNEPVGLAVGLTGDVYVAGETLSTDLPGTSGAAQAQPGGGFDGFVARLDPNLTRFVRTTYLGAADDDTPLAIAVHPTSGEVLVAGTTSSTAFPAVAGGARPAYGGGDPVFGGDGFVSREELLEMMRLGAAGELTGWAFDAKGRIIKGGTNARLTSIPPQVPADALTIGAAVGPAKALAIRAALKGRLINGLVTDEATAGTILKQ